MWNYGELFLFQMLAYKCLHLFEFLWICFIISQIECDKLHPMKFHVCVCNHSILMIVFSSAADIISRSYPIPSHPSPDRLPSSFLFSNPIGSLCFHLIFPIFGLDVHNNIAQNLDE